MKYDIDKTVIVFLNYFSTQLLLLSILVQSHRGIYRFVRRRYYVNRFTYLKSKSEDELRTNETLHSVQWPESLVSWTVSFVVVGGGVFLIILWNIKTITVTKKIFKKKIKVFRLWIVCFLFFHYCECFLFKVVKFFISMSSWNNCNWSKFKYKSFFFVCSLDCRSLLKMYRKSV